MLETPISRAVARVTLVAFDHGTLSKARMPVVPKPTQADVGKSSFGRGFVLVCECAATANTGIVYEVFDQTEDDQLLLMHVVGAGLDGALGIGFGKGKKPSNDDEGIGGDYDPVGGVPGPAHSVAAVFAFRFCVSGRRFVAWRVCRCSSSGRSCSCSARPQRSTSAGGEPRCHQKRVGGQVAIPSK